MPGLAPRRNTISEYANADVGWLMVAGFLAWALSLAATAELARRDGPHTLLVACFAVAALGMLAVACFPTQTVASVLPADVERTTTGRLHDLGAAAVMLALFAATLVASWTITWPSWFRRWALALLAFAVIVGGALLAGGDEVGGLRQRLLVLTGCGAQSAVLIALGERAQAGTGASSSARRRSTGSSSG